MYLENINSPHDIKHFTPEKLKILCQEIREAIINRVSKSSGHLGPNLGIVELTTALHFVFDSPKDKFIFDTSHQCYPHKILTGRKDGFLDQDKFSAISGFSNPDESEHDFFKIGHTSSSLSLANGLAKARDIKGEQGNIIAVIGDGSLSGGIAFEGLNNIIENGTNTIVVVNDNEMSIAENHGGIYNNLKLLRDSNGSAANNIFTALGFDYIYLNDGNDISKIIEVLQKLKDSPKPVVFHIHTQKGKGLTFAEQNPEQWHYGYPFDKDGNYIDEYDNYTYNAIAGDFLLDKMSKDKNVVAITSGTPSVIDFTKAKRTKAGKQFVDVGIAEGHGITYAASMAKGGAKVVYPIHSSFLQRALDSVYQDMCLNKSPLTLLVFGSVFGMKDATHLGLFDNSFLSNVPELIYLAPTCKQEYLQMLDWSIEQTTYPVAIKVPGGKVIDRQTTFDGNFNKYEIKTFGEKIAIIGAGTFFPLAQEVAKALKENNITATVINPRCISHLDIATLTTLSQNHKLIITLEDGIIDGGFGQKVASFFSTYDIKVKAYGIAKSFPDRYNVKQLLKENRMTCEQITSDIITMLK